MPEVPASHSRVRNALVITPLRPLVKSFTIRGTLRRFRLFMEAIGEIVDTVELVHLIGSRVIAASPDIEELNAEQSSYLQLPVSTHLIELQAHRRRSLVSRYLSGIPSIYKQDVFSWFSGMEQVAKLAELLDRSPDIVFVHRLSAMLPVLRSKRRPERMYFDLDDIEHRVRFQTALQRPIRKGTLAYLSHVPAIAAAERRAAAQSRLTFVCSELDRVRLRWLGFPRVTVIPNAINAPSEPADLPRAPTVLFLGICEYPPNREAAERLVRQIFPRIRAIVPGAQLFIAGDGSLDLPSAREHPAGVRYLGFVVDLPALYASARVICCPITSGSGTRVKIIEAAGYARPVVATTFAAEGLDFRDGVEILLRDDDDAIAAECVRLMRDDALCRELGRAARNRMHKTYDASAIRKTIVEKMSEAVPRGTGML
jgi:glycosyltransferase involved in cell wall biosynthesis